MLFWLLFNMGGQPKEEKQYFEIIVMRKKKNTVIIIVKMQQIVLDNLYLIWVYYRLHYVYTQFQPSKI